MSDFRIKVKLTFNVAFLELAVNDINLSLIFLYPISLTYILLFAILTLFIII